MTAAPPRVLVVEDDGDLRELLTLVLEGEGFETESAANGRIALAAIERRRPDLILLDMKMPVMDGWELARELTWRGHRPPIVVLTAAPEPATRAEEIGAEGWLGKPFDSGALRPLVRRLLEGQSP